MSELTLIKNIELVLTQDSERREIEHGYVLVGDNIIQEVGQGSYVGPEPDLRVDGRNKIMLPGLINTHHHLFQTLFRNARGTQNSKLFRWLTALYPRWSEINEGAIYISSLVGIFELLLSGATTTSDHLYIYPPNSDNFFDAEIEAAREAGIRFHPTRGSMSLSREEGGLPPKSVAEDERQIIEESRRVIEEYHDPNEFSMLRVALAPCSPFSVTESIMRETLNLAREYDVLLHTHLSETEDENKFCEEKFGSRSVEYMGKLGWLNRRVWFTHLVHVNSEEIDRLGDAEVGLSHCPSSNMRLGSGIAPVTEMKDSGIKISLAVDGSASNDTSNMIKELRQALLLQRVKYGAEAMTAREILEYGTLGGARVLGREDELGSIEKGKAADLVMVDLTRLQYAGGLSDPVSALLLCDTNGVDFNMVNGEILVKDGELVDVDVEVLIEKQNRLAEQLN